MKMRERSPPSLFGPPHRGVRGPPCNSSAVPIRVLPRAPHDGSAFLRKSDDWKNMSCTSFQGPSWLRKREKVTKPHQVNGCPNLWASSSPYGIMNSKASLQKHNNIPIWEKKMTTGDLVARPRSHTQVIQTSRLPGIRKRKLRDIAREFNPEGDGGRRRCRRCLHSLWSRV